MWLYIFWSIVLRIAAWSRSVGMNFSFFLSLLCNILFQILGASSHVLCLLILDVLHFIHGVQADSFHEATVFSFSKTTSRSIYSEFQFVYFYIFVMSFFSTLYSQVGEEKTFAQHFRQLILITHWSFITYLPVVDLGGYWWRQITLFVVMVSLKHDKVNCGKAARNTCKSYTFRNGSKSSGVFLDLHIMGICWLWPVIFKGIDSASLIGFAW